MASTAAPTPSEYIVHHLGHLNSSGRPQDTILNMSIINYDTLFWSISMALVTAFVFWRIAKSMTSAVPTRTQALAEMVFEMVDEQAKGIVPSEKSRLFVVPLALTAFVWIILMNALDLLPLDLPHYLFAWTGLDHYIHYHRIVPTADLNGTMGMSLCILLLMFYYNIKIKTAGGFVSELFTAPFHAHGFMAVVLAPVNFLLNLIEFAAKTVSLGMRLFGNMFAGELVFMLIALMGAAWTGFNFTSIALGAGHFIAGLGWAIFHILIVLLQAFIFMMLTLVYIGQAHEGH